MAQYYVEYTVLGTREHGSLYLYASDEKSHLISPMRRTYRNASLLAKEKLAKDGKTRVRVTSCRCVG